MKKDKVPQDRAAALEGHQKVVYAVDDQGRYATTGSSGWDAEQTVLDQALAHFDQLADEALQRVRNGTAAPLEYHMYRCRMDVTLLAQSAGLARWRVRRHLRPGVFGRLPERMLDRYAGALGLTAAELREVPASD